LSTVPKISSVQLGMVGDPTRPLLVLGPSLGTSAVSLWGQCGELLAGDFHVLAWDLPGHGTAEPAGDAFSITELATGVLAMIEEVLVQRSEPRGTFLYAGDSVGGAVGIQLMLDHPGRISAAAAICTGARIGTPEGWSERAELVRASGTPIMVQSSATRWFAPGFIDREHATASALLHALKDADRSSYAWVCDALSDFDVRDRLTEITTPVLAVAGGLDEAAPIIRLREIADRVQRGHLVVLDDVAHLPPAEAPAEVARLIAGHARRSQTVGTVQDSGMAMRRSVLGDAHVDQATKNTTDFTRDFQDLITEYAWGSIWTRPGLDRRSRSLITLTALVARGHHDELAIHLRAARTNGLSNDEIKELLLQTAIYCGVPDANTAFRIAQDVLASLDTHGQEDSR
jgi:3-oxoadipate enol-lactonase / 4-carboxymuconolactone decarboxylase